MWLRGLGVINLRYNCFLWLWVPDRRAPRGALVRDDGGMFGGGLPHTIRNTTAPNAPAHSAIAAIPWIAKPGPRFAAAFE
ncbi:hypothetical protein ABIF66_002795 [Bradyrhizobium japonicum]